MMKKVAAADYLDLPAILREADIWLGKPPVSITGTRAPQSQGDAHAYYSNGDYWWPNPDTEDGLPFVQRDGETYPGIFSAHRECLRTMRRAVSHLASAWHITQNKAYAGAAIAWLETFFLRDGTYMAPHLCYAQAIPGVSEGRGIGIIDTLHLIDVPAAIELLQGVMAAQTYDGLKAWFAAYLRWMNTHPNGIEEREWTNNHAVAWYAQASAFARFTGDADMLRFCRDHYKTQLLKGQMAPDGSFPLELRRTKPYYYSSMVLDCMSMVCQFASDETDDLWCYHMADGRGLRLGIDYLLPYIEDKRTWPLPPDVEHWAALPVAMPYMLFAGLRYDDARLLRLWRSLDQHTPDAEIRRSIGIRCPYLHLC